MGIPKPNISTWFSREHTLERIITFNASWFTVCLGTSALPQVLNNFPYRGEWMLRLGYCSWILTIILLFFFLCMFFTRCIMFPHLSKSLFSDFQQTSFLGAIPATLVNIGTGALIFYSGRPAAVWAAYGIFWITVFLDILLASIVVFIVLCFQHSHEMESVTGVWLLSFIPLIVTAAAGGALAPHLNHVNAAAVIVVSLINWAVGLGMCLIITTIYWWRLVRYQLPVRDAIVSCFIPIGPPGMGAYAIGNLSVALAAWIRAGSFTLHYPPPAEQAGVFFDAVCEMITWLGLCISLLLFGFATFWLLQAVGAVILRIPKTFNIGFWAFVFPMGVYTNAASFLASSLRNSGFKGWAATCAVATLLVWTFNALATTYKAVYLGQLFFGPGLEAWEEKKAMKDIAARFHMSVNSDSEVPSVSTNRSTEFDKEGDGSATGCRVSKVDGTFDLPSRTRSNV